MADLLLFHHAQGLTPGVRALAGALVENRHDNVHVPDLYEGATYDTLDAGVAHAERELGFDTVVERGVKAAQDLPDGFVLVGLSLGVLPAHALASRARGALLLHSSVPDWPAGLPLQLHVMSGDAWGDVEVGRELAAAGAELFEYPGDRHLFTDAGLDAYDKAATALVVERARAFIADLG